MMAKAKDSALNLLRAFRRGKTETRLNITVGPVPGFFDGDDKGPKAHTVLGPLSERFGGSDPTDTLRHAFFAGCLDDLVGLDKSVPYKPQTLVRFFNESSGLHELMPIASFIGHRTTDENRGPTTGDALPDPDQLTSEFLWQCYGASDDFRLPKWEGKHAQNTIGLVRALAWLHRAPDISFKYVDEEKTKFASGDGTFIKVVETDEERKELIEARFSERDGDSGTGVNEFAAFIWCPRSVAALGDRNLKSDELLNSLVKLNNKSVGTVHLEMHATDHVALEHLIKKAHKLGIVGPLRLSAGALIVDRVGGAVVIQQKREQRRAYPYHTFGGSFMAKNPEQSNSYAPSDGTDLVRCARREVLEEGNIALSLSSLEPYREIPALLALQTDKPFLQLCFLGWQVPPEEVESCFINESPVGVPNSEGGAVRMPIVLPQGVLGVRSVAETFADTGARDPWRPSGLLSLYAWFKIGCPGLDEESKRLLKEELNSLGWPRPMPL